MRLIDADRLVEEWRGKPVDLPIYTPEKVVESIEAAPTVEVPRWVPISERLPGFRSECKRKYGDYSKSVRVLLACVLVNGERTVMEGYCMRSEDDILPWWKVPGKVEYVTHWMPLPPPPKED